MPQLRNDLAFLHLENYINIPKRMSINNSALETRTFSHMLSKILPCTLAFSILPYGL